MTNQYEILVMDSQNMEESRAPVTPVTINGWVDKGERQTKNLTVEDVKDKEITREASFRRKRYRSLVRVYLRRFKRMKAKVHPLDRPVSPQLLIQDGKMEVWNPDLTFQDDEGDKMEVKNQSLFGCCSLQTHDHNNGDWTDVIFSDYIKKIEVGFGSGVASVFKFMRWVVIHNIMLFLLWGFFLILPTAISFDYSVLKGKTFKAENLLDGNGAMQYLWFFYGAYPSKNMSYRIDAAYVIIALLTYFGTLFMLLRGIAKSEIPIKGSQFSLLLFASWNFSINTEQDKKSFLMNTSVDAKDLLSEAKTKEEARAKVRTGKYKLLLGRIFAWIVSIALTGLACAAIYFFLTKVTVAEFISSQTNIKVANEFLKNNGLSLVFSLINGVLPAIITKLVKLEGYAKVTNEIRVNVIRVFSLRFLSIVVLMITLYSSVTSSTFKGCGGTFIGQEFYKIMMFDIIFVQTLRFFFKAFIAMLQKEKKEPDVAALLLQVVYRQALIWSGTFFCPFISFLGLLSQILVFFLNYALVYFFCKAPNKRFRNVGTTSFYKACMAVTLSILLIPAVTVLGSHYVSIGQLKMIENFNSTCGPFGNKPPLDVLEDITSKNNIPDWLYKTYNWFTSAAVFPVFLVLSTIIYVQTVRLRRQKAKFKELEIDHNKFKMKTNARLVRVATRH